jgi:large subunit ribosomal protein L18
MITKINKKAEIKRRHDRVRRKISGTADRPRLAVSKSNKNIIAQIIDDTNATTLVYVSTLDKEVKTKASNVEAAAEVGKLVAERAKKAKINTVVFDRNGYLYHGKVKALAEAAREAGLEF